MNPPESGSSLATLSNSIPRWSRHLSPVRKISAALVWVNETLNGGRKPKLIHSLALSIVPRWPVQDRMLYSFLRPIPDRRILDARHFDH